MEGILGVRKGAWSRVEDDLLRACVERYGEGKWHLVPIRAGLNRCRKSCRLRWLNYLKPNIKRGEFSEDEVDLMIRMHRLLGNRWSLIAGRLPGRTPNDVKNYWNTYVRKTNKPKQLLQQDPNNNNNVATKKAKESTSNSVMRVRPHEVIRPQPRTFSKTSPWLRSSSNNDKHKEKRSGGANKDFLRNNAIVDDCAANLSTELNKKDSGSGGWFDDEWWGNVLGEDNKEDDDNGCILMKKKMKINEESENTACNSSSYFGEQDWKLLKELNWDFEEGLIVKEGCDNGGDGGDNNLLIEGHQSFWSGVPLDINLWDS